VGFDQGNTVCCKRNCTPVWYLITIQVVLVKQSIRNWEQCKVGFLWQWSKEFTLDFLTARYKSHF